MASSKLKISRKAIIQIVLLLTGSMILFLTYFVDLKKKDQVSEKIEEVKVSEEKDQVEKTTNTFEDVEYKGIDTNGNRFVINSRFADFEIDRPRIINMTDVKCVFYFKDNSTLTITSDSGIYNNVTLDMIFETNVRMRYLENMLLSERADFKNEQNLLLVEGNVHGENPEGTFKADRMKVDLNDKKVGLSMLGGGKVDVKVKIQWERLFE